MFPGENADRRFPQEKKAIEFERHTTDCYNHAITEEDTLRAAMFSRAYIKMLKLASLSSILNHDGRIMESDLEWAIKMHEYEFELLSNLFTIGSQSGIDESAGVIIPIIYKIISGEYKESKNVYFSPILKNRRMFTFSQLHQRTCKKREVIRWNDLSERGTTGRSGLQKILSHLVDTGYLRKVQKSELKAMGVRAEFAYQITDEFNLFVKKVYGVET